MAINGNDGRFPLDRTRFVVRCRLTFVSRRESIDDVVAMAMEIARECGCEGERGHDLEIALREAVANAVIHGNDQDVAKHVHMRCYGDPGNESLIVAVRDQGLGFDPDGVPDPTQGENRLLAHGRGLLLMRQLLDHIEFRKGGREVVLYKRC